MSRPVDPTIVALVLSWYREHARDLPWRRPGTSAWAILVSEVMLQQTPVARVEGPWRSWLDRWPTPADLAREPVAEAIRAWGRLGYPRRALRLHEAATAILLHHDGRIPDRMDELRRLPGVGEYTAAAVASFAFGQRQVVLDTNVRRLLARAVLGSAQPTRSGSDEWAAAEELLPRTRHRAAGWAAASMEVGALLCTARTPKCQRCPLRRRCAWVARGRPEPSEPAARPQPYQGTDRQCRGVILALLRDQDTAETVEALAAWPDREQAERAVASLVSDGLASTDAAGRLTLGAGSALRPLHATSAWSAPAARASRDGESSTPGRGPQR